MKYYSCTVRLAGDIRHEVFREWVSAAELAIMAEMHGEGSIVGIREAGDKPAEPSGLREHLRSIYSHSENQKLVFARVFPGLHTPLPETIEQIGLTLTNAPVPEAVPTPPDPKLEDDEVEKAIKAEAELAAVSEPAPPVDHMAKMREAKKAKALASA